MANTVKTRETKERPLSPQMLAFAEAWIEHGVGLTAYRQAYPRSKINDGGASGEAARLLADPRVIKRVQELRLPATQMAQMNAAEWLEWNIDIATADVNELIQSRRICCRYCHGEGHRYQWKDMAEFGEAVASAIEREKIRARSDKAGDGQPIPLPESDGGFGFRFNAVPDPDCPQCLGEGEEDIFLADTRFLSRKAKRLYAGVERTRNGVKVLTRSQDAALVNIGKYLGVLVERTKHEGAIGIAAAPLQLSPEQAAEIARALQDKI